MLFRPAALIISRRSGLSRPSSHSFRLEDSGLALISTGTMSVVVQGATWTCLSLPVLPLHLATRKTFPAGVSQGDNISAPLTYCAREIQKNSSILSEHQHGLYKQHLIYLNYILRANISQTLQHNKTRSNKAQRGIFLDWNNKSRRVGAEVGRPVADALLFFIG